MEPLLLETRLTNLEQRLTIAIELATLSLEKLDELRNKVKFAMEQEITSDDENEIVTIKRAASVDTLLTILQHKSNMKTKYYFSDDEKNDKDRRNSSIPRCPSPRESGNNSSYFSDISFQGRRDEHLSLD